MRDDHRRQRRRIGTVVGTKMLGALAAAAMVLSLALAPVLAQDSIPLLPSDAEQDITHESGHEVAILLALSCDEGELLAYEHLHAHPDAVGAETSEQEAERWFVDTRGASPADRGYHRNHRSRGNDESGDGSGASFSATDLVEEVLYSDPDDGDVKAVVYTYQTLAGGWLISDLAMCDGFPGNQN